MLPVKAEYHRLRLRTLPVSVSEDTFLFLLQPHSESQNLKMGVGESMLPCQRATLTYKAHLQHTGYRSGTCQQLTDSKSVNGLCSEAALHMRFVRQPLLSVLAAPAT